MDAQRNQILGGYYPTAPVGSPALRPWDSPPLQFPVRLMKLMQLDDLPEGIWWLQGGTIFAIDSVKFRPTLVTHFNNTKFDSFTRTLNKWGFQKLSARDLPLPPKCRAYFSHLFLRDRPELSRHMIDLCKAVNKKRKNELCSKIPLASEVCGSVYPPVTTPAPVDHGDSYTPSQVLPNRLLDSTARSVPTVSNGAFDNTAPQFRTSPIAPMEVQTPTGRVPSLPIPAQRQTALASEHFLQRRLSANSNVGVVIPLEQFLILQSQQQLPLAAGQNTRSGYPRPHVGGWNPLPLATGTGMSERKVSVRPPDPPDAEDERNAKKERSREP